MTISFFFDESGHSGDLVKSGVAYDFLDQPFFVLAALGIEDAAPLPEKIKALRIKHRIQAGELKSKSLQSQPTFVAELLSTVLEMRLPLFVEVVDKRYFICMNLVSYQLLPPVMGFSDGPDLHFIKNIAVDFLYNEVSEDLLNSFINACINPSDHSMMTMLESWRLFLEGHSSTSQNQEIRDGMRQMVSAMEREYYEMRMANILAHLRFLPPPDLNKHSKRVWMLPNLASFTNIYARINRFRRRKLTGVRLVHDQQLEVEEMLREAKSFAESIKNFGPKAFTPASDYIFQERASLDFMESHESLGIQIADVIAGTVMRFFRDMRRNPERINSELAKSMGELRNRSDPMTGFGLNQVVPGQHVL